MFLFLVPSLVIYTTELVFFFQQLQEEEDNIDYFVSLSPLGFVWVAGFAFRFDFN